MGKRNLSGLNLEIKSKDLKMEFKRLSILTQNPFYSWSEYQLPNNVFNKFI